MSGLPVKISHWRYDTIEGLLISNDECHRLDPQTRNLLNYFLAHPCKVLSIADLSENVWQGRVVCDDSIRRAVSRLRHVLDDKAFQPRFIETLPRQGFRFIVSPEYQISVKQPNLHLAIWNGG